MEEVGGGGEGRKDKGTLEAMREDRPQEECKMLTKCYSLRNQAGRKIEDPRQGARSLRGQTNMNSGKELSWRAESVVRIRHVAGDWRRK